MRCKACNVILDVDSKEGFENDLCHVCNRASYDGEIYESDKYGETVKLVGFEEVPSMSDPLGGVQSDLEILTEISENGILGVDRLV